LQSGAAVLPATTFSPLEDWKALQIDEKQMPRINQ
jgi:hypothetical protein